jgi:hypothetical protein
MASRPKPGSDEAIKQGCACPVLDNAHGKGSGYRNDAGKPLYWVNAKCPLHGSAAEWLEEDDEA